MIWSCCCPTEAHLGTLQVKPVALICLAQFSILPTPVSLPCLLILAFSCWLPFLWTSAEGSGSYSLSLPKPPSWQCCFRSPCALAKKDISGAGAQEPGVYFLHFYLLTCKPYDRAGTEVLHSPGTRVDLWWPVHGLFLSLYSDVEK